MYINVKIIVQIQCNSFHFKIRAEKQNRLQDLITEHIYVLKEYIYVYLPHTG